MSQPSEQTYLYSAAHALVKQPCNYIPNFSISTSRQRRLYYLLSTRPGLSHQSGAIMILAFYVTSRPFNAGSIDQTLKWGWMIVYSVGQAPLRRC